MFVQVLPCDRVPEDVVHLSVGAELVSCVWRAGSLKDWVEIPAEKPNCHLFVLSLFFYSTVRLNFFCSRTHIAAFLRACYHLIPFTAGTEAVQTLELVSRSHACFVDVPKTSQSLIVINQNLSCMKEYYKSEMCNLNSKLISSPR